MSEQNQHVEKALEAAWAAPAVFLSVTSQRARREAAAAAYRLAEGRAIGVLDGATVSWKDMIQVEGVVTTAGSKTRMHYPPAMADADVVARASRAGLITVGTTNLSEFAFSGVGQNPHFGTPLNYGCIPGGSSSGAAASVAQGIVRLAVGTDTAGSCRIPAAFHGLFGFRPTRGRYPMGGVLPLAPAYDTVGLIAASAGDLGDMDAVLTGEENEPFQTSEIRLDRDATAHADPEIAGTLYKFFSTIDTEGLIYSEVPGTALSEAMELIASHGWPGGTDAAALHADLIGSDQFSMVDPLVAARLLRAARIDADGLDKVRANAAKLRAEWPGKHVFVALPTVALGAPPAHPLLSDPAIYAATNARILSLTMPASLLDLPALSLPVGRISSGKWVGLQLVGAPNTDRALLAVARRLEQHLCKKRS